MFTPTFSVVSLLSLMASVSASSLPKRADDLKPTGPGPNDSYKIGGECSITFLPDTSGSNKWKNLTIDFMTGANQDMTLLTNVATNIDGTSASSSPVTWTCPEVDPPSAIYFYQFTHSNEEDPMWTTRFLITDANGNSVDPPQSKQPGSDGEDIPWGVGKIVGQVSSGSGSTGGSGSGSSPSSQDADSSSTDSQDSDSSAVVTSTLTSTSSAFSSAMSTSASSTPARAAQTSNASSNDSSDAIRTVFSWSLSALAAVALGMSLI